MRIGLLAACALVAVAAAPSASKAVPGGGTPFGAPQKAHSEKKEGAPQKLPHLDRNKTAALKSHTSFVREEKREKKEAREEKREAREEKKVAGAKASAAAAAAVAASFSGAASLHVVVSMLLLTLLGYVLWVRNRALPDDAFRASLTALGFVYAAEAIMHLLLPAPALSVGMMIFASVVFTINPVEHPSHSLALSMGTVPATSVIWLGLTRLLGPSDLARSLYGSETLRPYHLVVMFLGSVYLCTALERSGFLHTAALRVVERYGRSPWGLFWALGIFSGMLTVLIPDDIVTMTLTPITIRMCQLLNLPEVPFLFSQFFAGNIWAVTLVTGNPTNVLLAEDLGDTFMSFAGRMGLPGIAAGLTSFALLYATNYDRVDVVSSGARERAREEGGGEDVGRPLASSTSTSESSEGGEPGAAEARLAVASSAERAFTPRGVFCLVRVLSATAFCALEGVHGLPVYLVVLIIGAASFVVDFFAFGAKASRDVLDHMPWELFSFVTGFLVLAEAMAVSARPPHPPCHHHCLARPSRTQNAHSTPHPTPPPDLRHLAVARLHLPAARALAQRRLRLGLHHHGLLQRLRDAAGHPHRLQDDRLGARVEGGRDTRRGRGGAPLQGRAARGAVGRHLRLQLRREHGLHRLPRRPYDAAAGGAAGRDGHERHAAAPGDPGHDPHYGGRLLRPGPPELHLSES